MKFLILMMTVTLTGCGALERMGAWATGYNTICVDGVSYVQFTSGAAVQADADNKPKKCK